MESFVVQRRTKEVILASPFVKMAETTFEESEGSNDALDQYSFRSPDKTG